MKRPMAATPNEDGTWFLYLWGPTAMLNRAEQRDSTIRRPIHAH
jgi:hypothetical protein